MAFDTTVPRNDYVGTNTLSTYSFGFRIFAATDLRVTKVDTAGFETALVYPTDFTIPSDAVNNPSGSTITLVAGNLETGHGLTIRFDRTPQQSTDLRNQGSFFAEVHEDKFDELTRYVQQLKDVLARSIHLPETEAGTVAATQLSTALLRADKFLAFDASGNLVLAAGTSESLTPVSAFIYTLLDDVDAATARATLGASQTVPADNVFRVKGSADGTKKIALEVDGLTTATTRTLTAQDQDGTIALTTNLSENPIINGNMEIWQRGTSFVAVANGAYAADRWRWNTVGAGVVTISRSSNVPTVAEANLLFNYSLDVDVTTADASLAATDLYAVEHRIEGYNWRHFAQRIFNVSFWVRDTKTGLHAVAFTNSGADRSFVAPYTINVADTWEYKTVFVDASPSAGTWNYTTGVGLAIRFTVAAGSNFNTAAGAWATGNFYNTTTTDNAMDSTANFFRITGIKLELGGVATPIQFVPFEEELARAQRYYAKGFPYATAPASDIGVGYSRWYAMLAGAVTQSSPTFRHRVEMRQIPTYTLFNSHAPNAQVRNVTDSSDLTASAVAYPGVLGFNVTATGTAGTAIGEELSFNWTADAEL